MNLGISPELWRDKPVGDILYRNGRSLVHRVPSFITIYTCLRHR